MLKLHDVHDKDVVIEAELSYSQLQYAQIEYERNQDDGSIMLTINDESTKGIDASLDLTVEDAEKLAIHILGLCAAVKTKL